MFERIKYWVWLSMMDSMGSKKMNSLIELFGDPLNVWHSSSRELKQAAFLNEVNLRQLTDKNLRKAVLIKLEELKKREVGVVTIKDRVYPDILKNIYDPPVVLYFKGKLKESQPAVAIVGSRKASKYGLETAYRLAYELSMSGITIISGLAKGIDTYAHKGAVEARGRTQAVLGCGIDKIYPPENKELYEIIVETGTVISEYLPGTKPMPYNFPARNRIISGMSLGTIIVEAGERSGSLITANFALDQGREVFSVPGNIDSINSKGTNKLIREGAKIVTCVDDITEELKLSLSGELQLSGSVRQDFGKVLFPPNMSEEERKILYFIGNNCIHIDNIAENCSMKLSEAYALLTFMELSGYVEQLPGKVYKLDNKLLFQ